jgi:putative spermidine/putrescine transport system ATP-binding protein
MEQSAYGEDAMSPDTRSPAITADPDAHAVGAPPALEVLDLHKVYDKGVHALRGIDLNISEGEFVTLLGPSGSGKTTLLMVIAGFESPTRGRVLALDRDITTVPPERRNFGVVFQSYALFPHMSVRANVGYPLTSRRVGRNERSNRINEALALVGLEGLGDRRPSQLSGGQQQRVALARALIYQPTVLLLDEPLGALDRSLRERMQMELRNLHRKVGVTFLYVTHDQDEALTMSDRIVVMRDGQIEQIGTPEEVYAHPVTEFVARFVGAANLLAGTVVGFDKPLASVALATELMISATADSPPERHANCLVLIRPERVAVRPVGGPDPPGAVGLDGWLESEVFAGTTWRCQVSTAAGPILAHMPQRAGVGSGQALRVSWNPGDAWLLPRWRAPGLVGGEEASDPGAGS